MAVLTALGPLCALSRGCDGVYTSSTLRGLKSSGMHLKKTAMLAIGE